MGTVYVLWDEANRQMETFHGPCRLAHWAELPDGWSIERFQWGVSQGVVTLASVKAHAEEHLRQLAACKPVLSGFTSDEEMDAREQRDAAW